MAVCVEGFAKIFRDQLIATIEAGKRNLQCFLGEQDFAVALTHDELQRILDLVAVCAANKAIYVAGTSDDQFAAGVDDPSFIGAIHHRTGGDEDDDGDKQRDFHILKLRKAAPTRIARRGKPDQELIGSGFNPPLQTYDTFDHEPVKLHSVTYVGDRVVFVFLFYVFNLEEHILGEVPAAGQCHPVNRHVAKRLFTIQRIVTSAYIEPIACKAVDAVNSVLTVFAFNSFVG